MGSKLNTISPSSAEIETSEPKTLRQKLTGSAFAISGASMMYLLMSGPLAWLHNKVGVGPFKTAIETMFAPVVFVVKNDIQPFSSLLKAYIGLFT